MKINRITCPLTGGIYALAFAASALWPAARLGAQATTYNFSLYAGAGVTLDHTDGTGANARFFDPVAAAVDASGNVYVADAGDHTIREIASGGVVSTLAGDSGQAGMTDGTGTSAKFVYPYAVAIGPDGYLYVADMGANNIRRVNLSTKEVSTYAGSTAGTAGSANGVGTAALFSGPQGIAVDSAGNVYVADTNNSTIRMIAAGTQNVTTLAGSAGQSGSADGTGNEARFDFPGGLAVDTHGDLYVADYDNSTIRLVNTTTGQVSTFAGAAGATGAINGAVGTARFDHPNGVAVDAGGNVYVADTSTQTIRMISGGNVTTLAGGGYLGGRIDATGTQARFFYPDGLAATAAGLVYVADTGNHTIRMVTAPAGVVTTYAGSAGTIGSANGNGTAAQFNYPYGVAADSAGNLYIADQNNDTIREVATDGQVTTIAGMAGVAGSADGVDTAARFNGPSGIAVDSSGRIFVADTGNSTIRMIVDGQVTTLAGTAGTPGSADGAYTSAQFDRPLGLAVDGSANVYVADSGNDTIRMVVPATGEVTTIAGVARHSGDGNGPGGGASFDGPYAVAVDGSGNVYVADCFNGQIRKLTPDGNAWTVSTLAGSAGMAGMVDGSGTAAEFNQPYGIAANAQGDLFVADTFNRAIRLVTPSGAVTTIEGAQSRFFYPQGVALDASGDLYVVDGDNQAVSKGVPQLPTGSSQVGNHTVAPGQSTTFTFGQAGAGLTYQWQMSVDGGGTWANVSNGGSFGGATTTALAISSTTAAMNGDEFRLVVSGGGSASATGAGTLYVGSERLVNLSTRGLVEANGQANLVAGLYISGTGTEQAVLRAIGPTLTTYGVTGVLPTPSLTVYNSDDATIASNTVWGGSATLANAFKQVGAFALPATSADSALDLGLASSGSTSYT
ncbi:MAG: hypothetical protein ACREFX_12875, partial [Opitutaceae bacterium]